MVQPRATLAPGRSGLPRKDNRAPRFPRPTPLPETEELACAAEALAKYAVHMKNFLPTLCIATICSMAALATARAESQTLHYPTEDDSLFTIDAPGDWEVTGIEEVGEFGTLESENGSILQFRAIECEDEDETTAEIEAIAESTTEFLEENYTDIELGEVTELEIDGMPAFELGGDGKDADGDAVKFVSAIIILGPTTIAEVWGAAYEEDFDAARAVLASFKPTAE
jgi:hypothetical protein